MWTDWGQGKAFVITTSRRKYYFLASSLAEASDWIETLQEVIGCNGREETKPTPEVSRPNSSQPLTPPVACSMTAT